MRRAPIGPLGRSISVYASPGPYISKQRSSNALTIIFDTWPKTLADTAAWTGFAKANERSRVTRVGLAAAPSGADGLVVCAPGPGRVPAGDCADAGWNLHTVSSALNNGVDEAATACGAESEPDVTGAMTGVCTHLDGLVRLECYLAHVAFLKGEEADGELDVHI